MTDEQVLTTIEEIVDKLKPLDDEDEQAVIEILMANFARRLKNDTAQWLLLREMAQSAMEIVYDDIASRH